MIAWKIPGSTCTAHKDIKLAKISVNFGSKRVINGGGQKHIVDAQAMEKLL